MKHGDCLPFLISFGDIDRMKWIVRSEKLSIVQSIQTEIIIDKGPPHLFDTEEEANKMLDFFHLCLGDIFFGGNWQVLAIN